MIHGGPNSEGGGGAFSSRGRPKKFCKKCGGNACRSHGRRKAKCKERGGRAICSRGRRKTCCIECGSAISSHGRQATRCKVRDGSGSVAGARRDRGLACAAPGCRPSSMASTGLRATSSMHRHSFTGLAERLRCFVGATLNGCVSASDGSMISSSQSRGPRHTAEDRPLSAGAAS